MRRFPSVLIAVVAAFECQTAYLSPQNLRPVAREGRVRPS